MRNRSGLYPRLAVDGQGNKVVSGAGGVLLTRTAAAVGLDSALSAALSPWRRPPARHDPGKVLLDLAVSLVMGQGRVKVGNVRSDLRRLSTLAPVRRLSLPYGSLPARSAPAFRSGQSGLAVGCAG